MSSEPYIPPAITELGTVHERTLNWMIGADGLGFAGHKGRNQASVVMFGGYTIQESHSSGSKQSKDPSGATSSAVPEVDTSTPHGHSGRHRSIDLSDALKPFGGSK